MLWGNSSITSSSILRVMTTDQFYPDRETQMSNCCVNFVYYHTFCYSSVLPLITQFVAVVQKKVVHCTFPSHSHSLSLSLSLLANSMNKKQVSTDAWIKMRVVVLIVVPLLLGVCAAATNSIKVVSCGSITYSFSQQFYSHAVVVGVM